MPDYADKINDFVTAIEALTVKEQQEYFLKTFDVQAICYLDLGYVMFGEDYKRAQLLVNLQNEHKVAGVDCGNELADHLPNVLTLLAQTSSNSFAEELGFIITIPAVRFMLTKFKNIDNYYKGLLEVLLDILQHDFQGDGLKEFAFSEESFSGKNEFLIPSPKMSICDSNCKQKRF
jgi:nitrate reductase assembly molybdenum cofactor insertion protein NarJ